MKSTFSLLCGLLLGSTAWISGCSTPKDSRSNVVPVTAAGLPPAEAQLSLPPLTETLSDSYLTVCSFNIQFLGHFVDRDDQALANLVAGYDIVVVQELIAAPGLNGATRQRAKRFFDAMATRGFAYVLSESDTGRKGPLPNYTTATEWFVTFYKPSKVLPALDLPHGFISFPLAANPDFVRVPYAAAFRTMAGSFDFVLVSVHLEPEDAAVRAGEFRAIDRWLQKQYSESVERDILVVGDTNLQSKSELTADTPSNFISLNEACVPTNTIPTGPKPYDHVFFNPEFSTEVDRGFGFNVINLVSAMAPTWRGPGVYPGAPYVHNEFRVRYSDHNPVVFRLRIPTADDD